MTRRNRTFAAWIALIALVFAQLATAAYACPQLAPPPAAEVAMTDCDHDMAGAPNLCERHCDYGKASVDKVKNFPAQPMAGNSVRPLVFAASPEQPPRAGTHPHGATGPPLTRFTVLRI